MRGNRMERVGDEIKREWRKLRAPESLVERTKEAAKQEEAKVAGHRKKMARYVAGGSVLAAAAVLFILITSLDMGRQAEEQVPPMSAGTWLRLGTAAEDKEIYLEEEVSMERASILPMAFAQAQREETICGVKVLFVKSDAGGWMAAYEDQEAYVVITARVDEEQEMVAVMERILEAQQ